MISPVMLLFSIPMSFLETGFTIWVLKGSAMALFFMLIRWLFGKRKRKQPKEDKPRLCTLPWMGENLYYEIFKEKPNDSLGLSPDDTDDSDT